MIYLFTIIPVGYREQFITSIFTYGITVKNISNISFMLDKV